MKKAILAFAFFSLFFQAKPEGYQVNLQGQKNTAMGHTGTGLLLGASSIHFNPGALYLLENKHTFSFGTNPIFSKVKFNKMGSDYQAETDSPVGTPFYFFGAYRLSEKFVAGFSVTTPFGNSIKWDEDWDGRFLIQDISLKAISMQPTLSFKITDKLGIGLGAMIVYGSVDLDRAIPVQDANEEGSVNLSGSTTSFGFNAGLFYRASDAISFGLNYRSKVNMKLTEGDANFHVPPSLTSSFPEGTKFDAELPLPANLTFGTGIKVGEKLTLAADLQYVFWSAYEKLVFDFDNEAIADSENERDYKNTIVYRLGAQYQVNKSLVLRAGTYYDNTPIKEGLLNPETPGANKVGVSCGASYGISDHLTLDVSFLYITSEKREDGYEPANFYGTYKSQAYIPGIGLSYTF